MAKTQTTASNELTVRRRSANGTRSVRRLRREGFIPGIVYGKGTTPLAVAMRAGELAKLLHTKAGEHALATLRLEGDAAWSRPVLVKAVQHDPVDGQVVHVDFQTVVLTERLRVKVPVVLKGEAVGVKQEGGILEHFLREVEIECLPTDIPASVEFDISGLRIGDTAHVRDLTPPKNTKLLTDPDGVIASLQKPKEEKPEEAVEAVAEPEVLREKKEEAEAQAPTEAPEPKKEKGKDA